MYMEKEKNENDNTEKLIKLFEDACENFMEKNKYLLDVEVHEVCLCGALMIEIHELMKDDDFFKDYYVDLEYNREGKKHKHMYISNDCLKNNKNIRIDMIIHSRKNKKLDNLMIIETKKGKKYEPNQKDISRLKKMTEKRGNKPISNVDQYLLGIFCYFEFGNMKIHSNYFKNGKEYKNIENI